MPFSLMLVGYPVAKPVLNVLGLMSGIYVFCGHKKDVCWKELKKIVVIMAVGIIGGIMIKGMFAGREQMLYKLLGVFVIFLSLQGVYKEMRGSRNKEKAAGDQAAEENVTDGAAKDSPALYLILVMSGIVHGIFVGGGPLLIGYLTKKIKDKVSFRATISTVWVFLNTMILIDDVRSGLWNMSLIRVWVVTIPFLLAGMYLGTKLYARMSQHLFMMISYALLFISGVSLLVK